MICIALGANLGEREKTICLAMKSLSAHPEIELETYSSFYETEPVGGITQPEFINAVISVKTDLSPEELLRFCHEVEANLGRVRVERWGPRVIDIDLLIFAEQVINKPGLIELPHQRLTERRFVLVPLEEIAPTLILAGQSISEITACCPDKSEVRLYADQRKVAAWLEEFK